MILAFKDNLLEPKVLGYPVDYSINLTIIFFALKTQNFLKMSKEVCFENPEVVNCSFVLNQPPLSTIFLIVQFMGVQNLYYLGTPCSIKYT